MNLKILSWNVRGSNNPQKRDTVKNLLKGWKYDVVCFQEIKLDSVDAAVVKSLWSNPFVDWVGFGCHSYSRGSYFGLGHESI